MRCSTSVHLGQKSRDRNTSRGQEHFTGAGEEEIVSQSDELDETRDSLFSRIVVFVLPMRRTPIASISPVRRVMKWRNG